MTALSLAGEAVAEAKRLGLDPTEAIGAALDVQLAAVAEQRLANLIAYAEWCERAGYALEQPILDEIRERLGLDS